MLYRSFKKDVSEYSRKDILFVQLSVIGFITGGVRFLMISEILFNLNFDFPLIKLDFFLMALFGFLVIYFLFFQYRKYCQTQAEVRVSLETAFSEDEEQEYDLTLKKVIEDERLYLRVDFSLDMLSEYTGHPRYKWAQYFNQLNMSFYEYFAEYKVRYAVKCIGKNKSSQTLASLANDCGFSSVTTFNKYFRECIGCSPREYRERKGAL